MLWSTEAAPAEARALERLCSTTGDATTTSSPQTTTREKANAARKMQHSPKETNEKKSDGGLPSTESQRNVHSLATKQRHAYKALVVGRDLQTTFSSFDIFMSSVPSLRTLSAAR